MEPDGDARVAEPLQIERHPLNNEKDDYHKEGSDAPSRPRAVPDALSNGRASASERIADGDETQGLLGRTGHRSDDGAHLPPLLSTKCIRA